MRQIALLVLGLVAAAAPRAQPRAMACPESSGPMAGAPAAFFMARNPALSFDPGALQYKPHGFRGKPPLRWSQVKRPAGRPDFSLSRALLGCRRHRGPLDIDAVSLGEDWILADANGRAVLPDTRWAWIDFSVTVGSKGAVGGAIRAESSTADGPGADVFTWLLPRKKTSNAMTPPPALMGRSMRAQDGREIDVGKGSGGTRRELNALDRFVPLYLLEPAIANQMPGPGKLTVYFSLTAASAALVPEWFGRVGPSGATVLRTTWTGRGWTCPTVWKTFRELKVDQREDVDALSVDLAHGHVLFSLAQSSKTKPRDEILYVSCRPSESDDPVPYTDPNGEKVSDKIGLIEIDDVDAICSMDPSIRRSPTTGKANPFYFFVGTPLLPLPSWKRTMGSSAIRDYEFDSNANSWRVLVRTWGIGWPPSGPGAGSAVLALDYKGNVFGLPPIPRTFPAPPWCGDPTRFDIAIPANLQLGAEPVVLRWFGVDQGLTELGQAWPVQVRL